MTDEHDLGSRPTLTVICMGDPVLVRATVRTAFETDAPVTLVVDVGSSYRPVAGEIVISAAELARRTDLVDETATAAATLGKGPLALFLAALAATLALREGSHSVVVAGSGLAVLDDLPARLGELAGPLIGVSHLDASQVTASAGLLTPHLWLVRELAAAELVRRLSVNLGPYEALHRAITVAGGAVDGRPSSLVSAARSVLDVATMAGTPLTAGGRTLFRVILESFYNRS